ncbi:MAG: alpha-amylase family glycosyl hydrolase, partial [Nitrososphaerales archaeon]
FFRDLAVHYFATETMDTATFIDGVDHMLALYAPQVTHCTHNLFSSHDVSRFLYEAEEDVTRLRLATLFQLTMPGAPGIYYGDEIAMSGGDDPDNRRGFPWDRPETWDRETLELTRTLIRLRKEHPALRLGSWRPVWQGDNAFAFERAVAGERVLVVINRGDAIDRVNLPISAKRAEVLWGQGQVEVDGESVGVIGVGARDGVIVRLS